MNSLTEQAAVFHRENETCECCSDCETLKSAGRAHSGTEPERKLMRRSAEKSLVPYFLTRHLDIRLYKGWHAAGTDSHAGLFFACRFLSLLPVFILSLLSLVCQFTQL